MTTKQEKLLALFHFPGTSEYRDPCDNNYQNYINYNRKQYCQWTPHTSNKTKRLEDKHDKCIYTWEFKTYP